MADGKMVAIRTSQGSQSPMMFYPILDHLGSVSAVVDGNMLTPQGQTNPNYDTVIDRYSYDAFGMARDPYNWAPLDCTKGPQPPFVRGFTGQEHLPDNVCLINFNTRLYDQQIGRFISADPTMESVYDGQDMNRYSYVLNNPLALTDPSGYGGFFNESMIRELAALVIVAVAPEALPAIGAELGFVTTSETVAGLVNAGIAGGISGAVATGTLKGSLMGAGEAIAFAGIHFAKIDGLGFPKDVGEYSIGQTASSAVMHGMVGGLFAVGQKGGFKSGFLAAGVGDLAGSTDAQEINPSDFIKHAVAGGVGSILGGGKFMNGAVTASFGYLFNDMLTAAKTGEYGSEDQLSEPTIEKAEAALNVVTLAGVGIATDGIGAAAIAGGEDILEGSFSISDWFGYPEGIPRPGGPFRLLEGEEYSTARAAADDANRAIHVSDPSLKGMQIHEISPVKFGGDPIDPANKLSLTPQQHAPITRWRWQLQKDIQK